ncbi:MAG: hypothetical protein ACLQGU_08190 [bacterium]
MRKLLVCLLAAAMLLAFTGVANAVADSEVLVFTAPISFPVHIVKESQAAVISTTTGIAKTTLVTKTHTFTGQLVANVSVVPESGTSPNEIIINEVFFCGTSNSSAVQIDFGSFATIVSDTWSGKATTEAATIDMIGTGDFFLPPASAAVGIDYLNAKATGVFTAPSTLSKIHVSGTIAGGFSNSDLTTDLTDAVDTSPNIFNATFSTTTLVPDTSCTQAATCSSAGAVVCTP